MPIYRCLNGLDYIGAGGRPVRREIGDLADDLPPRSVAALIAGGDIEIAPEDQAPSPVADSSDDPADDPAAAPKRRRPGGG